MKKQLKVFVARTRLVNINQLTQKVLAKCRKHEKLTCAEDGEGLNAKLD
jgi:hypothetical protein